VLSGLLLNVALYAVLRFKMILAGNPGAIAPGPLMLAMGTTSLLLAGLMLYRRRDIKRFFAYSSIEHMGIITFRLRRRRAGRELRRPAPHGAAQPDQVGDLLRRRPHRQVKGSQKFADVGGLTATHPWLGWGFVAGVVAIAGLPPLGLFMSEFLVITAAMARQPWLAIPLVVGLAIGFAALVMRLQEVAFGEPRGTSAPVKASLVPLYLHLAMVLVAGVFLPAPLVAWFQAVAAMLGG
jgi:hydrogenase-4 component F